MFELTGAIGVIWEVSRKYFHASPESRLPLLNRDFSDRLWDAIDSWQDVAEDDPEATERSALGIEILHQLEIIDFCRKECFPDRFHE